MDIYMDITIAISESGIAWRGKWAASLVASTDLDAGDESILHTLTGYGATPLEAAATLLARAASTQKARGEEEHAPNQK